jgi:mono/diheme cytochrome c family protein
LTTEEILIIALAVLVPAIVLWIVFFVRSRPRPAARLGIPHALRPAQPDEVLEGPRLERILRWGLVSTLVLAIFIPLYWLPERQRQERFEQLFEEESLHRGELIFAVPPALPDEAEVAEFVEAEEAIAFGMACAECHGADASGGIVPAFADPVTGELVRYWAPSLDDVFTRWDEEVVRFTIERGRPGTPMPTFGQQFGGPMTDQMVDDVILWLRNLPGNQQPPEGISPACEEPDPEDLACGEEIFTARCAVCHGPQGQGKDEPTMPEGDFTTPEDPDFTEIEGTWYPGMALWQGKVEHLTVGQHLATIRDGRRFAFMPQFAEAPVQGIPVPPNPLTDEQIEAVMNYERRL